MSKDDIWYGFLQAGDKSTPVVRDLSLDTKNPRTIYLFNYSRGRFLEYSLDIVESKLRELTADDLPLHDLQSAFRAACKGFSSNRVMHKWEKELPAKSVKVEVEPEPEPEEDLVPSLDDDFDDDFEEDTADL